MKSLVVAFFLFFAVAAPLAHSGEVPFNKAQFDAALAAGKPVAVVFHADWCPTCRAQAPVLKQLEETPELSPVTLYVANFDTEKALKAFYKVTQQSTIIVFKDGKESMRSTGVTQREPLAELLHHALS
jgi:thioredoxin 1